MLDNDRELCLYKYWSLLPWSANVQVCADEDHLFHWSNFPLFGYFPKMELILRGKYTASKSGVWRFRMGKHSCGTMGKLILILLVLHLSSG